MLDMTCKVQVVHMISSMFFKHKKVVRVRSFNASSVNASDVDAEQVVLKMTLCAIGNNLGGFAVSHLVFRSEGLRELRLIGRDFPVRKTAVKRVIAVQSNMSSNENGHFFSTQAYEPPKWASELTNKPSKIFKLGHFPTPIHKWDLPNLPEGTEVYIKRDDLTGFQLSGNKVRKLEFLISEAVSKGADTIITIGGIQSNHCRATAVAAKYAGLETHLILRTNKSLLGKDPGLIGNLLVERLIGAKISLVSKEDYVKFGSEKLGQILEEKLRANGKKPFVIPVGGSNSLGSWGYLEAIREIEGQIERNETGGATGFDDIVVACGSGGTTAGLALGSHLSSLKAKVHSFGVCDDPDYFYDFVDQIFKGMDPSGPSSREFTHVLNAKGLGYAISSTEELEIVREVAVRTGIILDPVYSGKALKGLLDEFKVNPEKWAHRKVLFIHTGGLLGMYDKIPQLEGLVGDWENLSLSE